MLNLLRDQNRHLHSNEIGIDFEFDTINTFKHLKKFS